MPDMTDAEREAMEAAAQECFNVVWKRVAPAWRAAWVGCWHAAREFYRREPPSPEEVERAAKAMYESPGSIAGIWPQARWGEDKPGHTEADREQWRVRVFAALTAARGGDDG